MHKTQFINRSLSALVPILVSAVLCSSASAFAASPTDFCVDSTASGVVKVNMKSAVPATVPGVPVGLKASISNSNSYPVSSGELRVQVVRIQDGRATDIVDSFVAAQDINMSRNSFKDVAFTWRVPLGLETGTYQIAGYVISAEQSVLNDPGIFVSAGADGVARIGVTAESEESVHIVPNSGKVNGEKYVSGAVAKVAPGKTIMLKTSIKNASLMPMQGTMKWRLYAWDFARPDSMISQTEEEVRIHPQQTVVVSYDLKDTTASAYYVEGELDIGLKRLYTGFRLQRTDSPGARIRTLAFNGSFAAGSAQAFACVRSVGGFAKNQRLEIDASDSQLFARAVIDPLASTSVMTPLKNVVERIFNDKSDFTLTARLYRGDTIEDALSVHYDCAALGMPCPQNSGSGSTTPSRTSPTSAVFWVFGILTAIIFTLGALAVALWRSTQAAV